jgi:tetratricopeptide (TPR) repeat protein
VCNKYSDFSNQEDSLTKAVGFYNRAYQLSNRKKYDSAIHFYSLAIENYPKFQFFKKAEAYFNRALNKRLNSDNEGAIEDYSLAIQFNPNYAKAYCNRGFARMKSNDFFNAIYDFTNAIKIDNFSTEITRVAYKNRGTAYFSVGQNGCDDLNKSKELGDVSVSKLISQYCN